jgi:hypothetical protein
VYFKYTETKLILLFNVIPLDLNAAVPAFRKFFNSVRKKFFGCVFNQFYTAPISLERIVTADETWMHHCGPESKAQIWLGSQIMATLF